ncbi:hypothetical protein Poli38472_010731 [Pythium oligandrum]|uniref:NmrA-like domain-containing protein n=1 Tax=Pythium oligandrum TaxID=41045 RepID=A0A8K1CER1_PYTOL|nr:hypothetical protein Poli38472_010731 [Pythium oligandrum]|eukprot:TMW61668.1 hypothetical protein Poli38472_010731 [Pythium oligandrum]
MPDSTATLLVTGAAGQLGKLVINHLLTTLQISPERIVAGTRNPAKLQDLADKGVQVRRLDFNDAESVVTAAPGVERVLLISSDDVLGREGAQKAAVEALVKAGVKHIVYTSMQALEKSLFKVKSAHAATEEAIKASKVSYSILRNGLYFENNIGSIIGALKSGQWSSAAQDGKASLLSREDLARAAAYTLASDTTENHVEVVEKPIQVVQVSVEELAKGAAAATGLPVAVVEIFASIDASTAAGLASDVTDGVEKLTGVKPQTHREWLAANKTFLKTL